MAVTTFSSPNASMLRRQMMIDSQLRPSDVTEPRVLAAIAEVDRETFVPAERIAMAYADRAVPLNAKRALNPVLTTARMIVDLAPVPGDRLLLIGAATGYAAALLAWMGVDVTAVEQDAALAAHARQALTGVAGVEIVEGPLAGGAPAGGPFDALLIDGCAEQIPAALVSQLRDGARVVSGIADGAVTRIGRGVRVAGIDQIALLPFADIECVSLPGFAVPRSFQF